MEVENGNLPAAVASPQPCDKPIHHPTLKEASLGFWVAAYAKSVCRSFVETGRPDADDFMSLCSYLNDLEVNTIGALPFHERAEYLHELELSQGERPRSAAGSEKEI